MYPGGQPSNSMFSMMSMGVINPMLTPLGNMASMSSSLVPVSSSASSTALMLKPAPAARAEESTKVYVGRIPQGTSDDFMERLLKVCGPILSWRRMTDAKGEPKGFGFCEFETVESMLACMRVMNNMPLFGNSLIIKVENKTENFIREWMDSKKYNWMERMRKKGIEVDYDELKKKEANHETLPWEEDLIKNDPEIMKQIDDIIQNRDIIEKVSSRADDLYHCLSKDFDPKLYKEHPREIDRERRIRNREKEREKQYRKLLEEWKDKELMKEKEKEREIQREKEKLEEKHKMIEKDLNYDSAEEKRKRKKNPEKYMRYMEDRKRMRDKEREEDAMELRREMEIRAQEEAERQKRWEAEQKRRQKRMEHANRPKTKFEHIEDEGESQNIPNGYYERMDAKLGIELADRNKKRAATAFKTDDMYEEEDKKHRPLTKLGENIKEAIKTIESEIKTKNYDGEKKQIDLAQIQNDEEARKKLEAIKELYQRLPKKKKEVFKYPIDWNVVEKHHILEAKVKPWINNKVKEYLGVEEKSVIQIIYKTVMDRMKPRDILEKLEKILDEVAEDFVIRMWQFIIFELMKIEANLV